MKELIPQLESWGKDPVLVEAVTAQNAQDVSLDDIKKRDETWRNTSDVDDFMSSIMSNKAAQRLLELEKSMPFLVELFLMDNQGANVAMTNKTSDYWQGDEAKFIQSFNGGQGKTYIGEVEYDDSVLSYLVQVSVPVIDAQGQTIGALTIGINLDEYEDQ
ncbi:PDC sensor domain-containing protein [Vibrio rhizosphaerae]|uniref:PDC sensor domain-containing protein n=1 Tax=Vibrio rhizosphaerae TaxID=398736 RepID=A0ABU4IZ76_9VIBR|nr:PDC sensor domain-containing protein [Vibrio rhizosphaerae]MDW6094645.1 PDC sensor domain-containing protein [Vibrio rhizosphaerae]